MIRAGAAAAVLLAILIGAPPRASAAQAAASGNSGDSPKELALAFAKRAKRARKAGHNAEAYLLYSQAAALVPGNRRYRAEMELLQTRATAESKPQLAAQAEPRLPSRDVPPEDVFDSLTQKEMAAARPLNDVPRLAGKPGVLAFNLNGDARTLFDAVAQAFGLEAVYDGDYPRTGPPIRFHVSGADYRDAIHDLEAATGSFVIPLSSRLFMVAQDTPTKRNDLEQTIAIAVPVPQVLTTQEITEMAQVVRQTTDIQKIAWDSADSTIVMRDRRSRVLPAVGVLEQLISYRPQVMIDLEFLEVDLSDMLSYGFNVTNTFSLTYLGQILHNVVTPPSGVTNLLIFGNGKTLFGLSVAEVQSMFNETITPSTSLYRAQLRAVSGQQAAFHSGEKYPVVTSGYVGATTATTGTVYTPPPVFTFVDLGLDMKLTPYVRGMTDTSLLIETTFQVLSGSSVNGIPIIGSRNVKTQVSVRNGEWTVVGTILGKTRSKAVAGFWGLAEIPILGELFKQTNIDNEDTDVLIGVRTHLLSLPPDQVVTKALRVGSDTRPFTPL